MKYLMRAALADWSVWVASVGAIIFATLAVIYQESFFTPLFFSVLFVIATLVLYVTVKITIIVVRAIKDEDR